MLIPFAAAALAAPAAQEHVPLHPATAAITIQAPDVQGVIRAYPNTAGAKMLADEDIHAAIGEMMAGEGADPVDPIALMMGMYNEQVAGGQMPPLLELAEGIASLSFSLDVPDGDMFAFIRSANQAEDETWVVENVGIRIVADFVDAAAQARAAEVFSQLLADEAPWKTELQALNMSVGEGGGAFGTDSITVWRYEVVEDDPPMWNLMPRSSALYSGGKRMAFSMGNVDAADFAAQLAAGEAGTSAAATFATGRKAIGAPQGTTIFEAHIEPFVERLLLEEFPAAVPALDLAEGLIGPVATMAIRGGHWRLDVGADGRFHMEGVHAPSQAGPMAGLLGAKPLDPSALTLAHPEALVTTVTSLDKKVLVNLITELANRQDPEAMAQIDEAFGFRPDRDLAQPLGNAVAYSLPMLGSLVAAPNLMVAVELEDSGAFQRGMDGLFRMLGDTSGGEVQVARDEYKKISTLYTASFPGLFGDMGGMGLPIDLAEIIKPTVTVVGDRAVLTLNKTHAKKEVRRVIKLAEDGAGAELHAGIMALGDLSGATTVSHADWATFLGGIYSQVKAFAPMLAGAGLPVDVTSLPPAETMTRYFQPSQRRVRIVGDTVRHSATSSFGPELTMTPVLMGFGVGAAVPMRMQAAQAAPLAAAELEFHDHEHMAHEDHDASSTPELDATQDVLVQLSVALTLYQIDHDGAVPAALADLTKGTANYPKGYLEGEIPTDGWGNAFVYGTEGKSYTLYSKGPDGADDGGAGDDVRAD